MVLPSTHTVGCYLTRQAHNHWHASHADAPGSLHRQMPPGGRCSPPLLNAHTVARPRMLTSITSISTRCTCTCMLAQAGGRPDIITAGDVLYEPANHAALLSGLAQLAAPHTLVLIAYRRRNAAEEGFAALAEVGGCGARRACHQGGNRRLRTEG